MRNPFAGLWFVALGALVVGSAALAQEPGAESLPRLSEIGPPTQCLIEESPCTIGIDPDGNVIFPGSMPSQLCGDRLPIEVRDCTMFDPEGRVVNGVVVLCEICMTPREPLVVVCGDRCPDGYQPVESRSDPACGENFDAVVCVL